jgi:hypothetical protein
MAVLKICEPEQVKAEHFIHLATTYISSGK